MSVDVEKTVIEKVHRRVELTSAEVTLTNGEVTLVELSWHHRSTNLSSWRSYEMQEKLDMLRAMYIAIHDILDHLGELPEDFSDGNE